MTSSCLCGRWLEQVPIVCIAVYIDADQAQVRVLEKSHSYCTYPGRSLNAQPTFNSSQTLRHNLNFREKACRDYIDHQSLHCECCLLATSCPDLALGSTGIIPYTPPKSHVFRDRALQIIVPILKWFCDAEICPGLWLRRAYYTRRRRCVAARPVRS